MRPISILKKIWQRMVISVTRRKMDSGYCYRAGDVVVDDFAEFSGIPLDIVVERVANFHRINADDWNALGAGSFSERAATFYDSSHNFIFGILSANPSPEAVVEKLNWFSPRILEAIRAHPGKKFLEFGGGIGVFCEITARMGKHVTTWSFQVSFSILHSGDSANSVWTSRSSPQSPMRSICLGNMTSCIPMPYLNTYHARCKSKPPKQSRER